MSRREAAQRRDLTDALAFFAVTLDDLRCARCDGSELVAVEPGDTESAPRAFCSECWPSSFTAARAA